jgi:hypothetical protein
MTLSSSLADADERATLLAWWRERTPALGPLAVDQAALFVEPAPGEPFVLWQPLPFSRGAHCSDRKDTQHDEVSSQ